MVFNAEHTLTSKQIDMDQQKNDLRNAVEKGNVEDMTKIIENGLKFNSNIGDEKNSVFCEKETALVLASKYGHYNCVERLLELGAGIYINGEGTYGYRYIAHDFIGAMVNAASRNHLDCAQLLAESRILKSCPGDVQYTSFLHNILKHIDDSNYIEISLSCLGEVEKKSFLNGWKGQNLLSLLLLHKCDISLLVDNYDVSVNSWDFNGLTPLIMAILAKDLRSARFLLTKGANVKIPEMTNIKIFESDGGFNLDSDDVNRKEWDSGFGRTALMYAACMGNPKMLSLLLEFVPLEVVNWNEGCRGFTPVMFAASVGDTESVSVFLNHGALLNIIDFVGYSPLDCAVTSGSVECLEFILKRMSPEFYEGGFAMCIHRNAPNLLLAIMKYYNETAFTDLLDQSRLMDAVFYDSLESAQVLVDNGHPIDYRNTSGMTALMFACLVGKDKGVEMLLKNGADVNAQSHEGATPVMFAACKGHVKCLKLLLQYKADLDVTDHHKGTVFSAVMSHTGPCLDVLLESGKLFDNSDEKCLKLVHKEAMSKYQTRIDFPVGNLIAAMQHRIFRFEWTNSTSLKNVCFAAINFGLSPAKFMQDNFTKSLLIYAFQKRDSWSVLKYLIANLYFSPEDYSYLIQQATVVPDDEIEIETNSTVPVSFYKTLFSQPLSLKVWSFLHVSKAISLSHCSKPNIPRSSFVDSLPIPESLKMKLSFRSPFSRLCFKDWDIIGLRGNKIEFHQLANLMFEKRSFWQNPYCFKECRIPNCKCEGIGHTLSSDL